MTKLPPAPLPPARSLPPAPAAGGSAAPAPAGTFSIRRGSAAKCGQRLCIYGTGGIGKTELASLGPNPVIIDVEGGARSMTRADVIDQDSVPTFNALLGLLRHEIISPYETVIVDSASRVEEMIRRHVIETIPHEKGQKVTSIEGYGWGKGYAFISEHWQLLFQAMDQLTLKGKHVVLIAHDCVSDTPSKEGADYIRWEPRLFANKTHNVRAQLKDWVDHLLFIAYDVAVNRDGRAQGSGSRTIYTVENPSYLAKSRQLPNGQKLPTAIPYPQHDTTIWNIITQS